MAEIVVSAFFTVFFEKLASEALKKLARSKGIDSELKKLKRSLIQIKALLNDAAQKEISDEAVKEWLNGLQHLAYDIDDVLDDLATEAMHCELTKESEGSTSMVRKLIPTCCTNFSPSSRMQGKLDDIATKLQELVEEKDKLGLTVKGESLKPMNNRRLQTSLIDASSILGREGDKDALLHKLLGDEPSDKHYTIVPIVGMGGLGKTTLARLLYEEMQRKEHFKLMAWVCVSDEFHIFNISKIIFQAIGGGNEEYKDLNLLQVALKEKISKKRFLIVLDDVWSESYTDWEILERPFLAGAPGSKVIITTRKMSLLTQLGYDQPYSLSLLSHDNALSLFCQHALGESNFDSYPALKPHGEGIVKKCDGLPLALIALGRLLRTKIGEEEWKEVLNSEIWELGKRDEIVPALRLSYNDLSSYLKLLFAYCSLFPKDYVFDKEELVLLWMAEGFLHQSSTSKSMERLVSLPTGGGEQKLKSLYIGGCNKLLENEFVGGQEKTKALVSSSILMLETLSISNCQNLKSITELSSYKHLRNLFIHCCPNMESFPDHELPKLTVLTTLTITNCESMDASFSHGLWPPRLSSLAIGRLKKPISEWGPQNFPTSLVHLRLVGGPSEDVRNFSQLSHLLPSSLTFLGITGFEKVESVSVGLQHLTSLQKLLIGDCPKGKYEQENGKPEDFQQQLKLKVPELLIDQEWSKRKRHIRVSSWRGFMKGGKKVKKGEIRPPKLKTKDPNKSYEYSRFKNQHIMDFCICFSTRRQIYFQGVVFGTFHLFTILVLSLFLF
ncbi:hypothetical protein LXL04_023224 [Taraxacum kok-saghyz]